MEDIENKVIDKIKKEHIVPTPKTYFKAKDIFFWAIFVVTLFVCGVGFGVITYLVAENDWEVMNDLKLAFAQKILISTPVFWITFVLIFGLMAYLAFTLTKAGYKRSRLYITAGLIFAILIGVIAYSVDLAENFESVAMEKLPFYKSLVITKKTIWDNPARGLLSGTVSSISDINDFSVVDFRHRVWSIYGHSINYRDKSDFEVGARIKIMGIQTASTSFDATEVRPW